jgi:hypothetical protein
MTGRVIGHCGEEKDAIMMVGFNPYNRSYARNKLLNDQVIVVDAKVVIDKQLSGQHGLPSAKVEQLSPQRIKLPEGQQEPVII